MSFLNLFLCLTLAFSTLAEKSNNYEQPFPRRARVGSYPLTNSSSTIQSSSSTTPLQPVDLATTTSDLTNIYIQPPRITSSLYTNLGSTFGSLDSDVESTTSITSTSDGSNVYMQRPRTTSSLTSQYGSMHGGSVPANYSSHLSTSPSSGSEEWSSSTSHAANKTTKTISHSKSKTSTGSSNHTTTFYPQSCSGTTTVYVSSEAPRTRTVTETYFVTIFGIFTPPPPVSTLLPFCDTVQIRGRNATSSNSNCSSTGHCFSPLRTTTAKESGPREMSATPVQSASLVASVLSGATFTDFETTSKQTAIVIIGDMTTPSFEPATSIPAQPIQTGPDAAIPTQERNVPTAPGPQSHASVDLGGIIASIFDNPFTAPKPAPSPPPGDSSNGGSSSGGSGPDRGSPEPGSVNAPTAPISPQNPPQHDNPVVGVSSQTTSHIVVGGMTFPANLQPTTVAIDGQIISINPSQVVAPGITVKIPPPAPTGEAPSPNSGASVSIDVKSNNIVIGGHTFTPGSPPTSTVINGQSFAVNVAQQQTPGAAITAPPSTPPTMAPKLMTVANVPLAVQSGTVVIGGQTFSPASLTTSVVIDGQTFTINPSQVIAPGTTIDILSATPTSALSAVTAGGLTFSVGSTAANISGTTYAIGGAASQMTKVIGGQTVSFGPGGVGFASTTVPAAPLSQVTAGGLTFTVGSTEAVISGTTYTIDNGALPTTAVIGGQTVSFGPNGVGLASTTVAVPTASSTTGTTTGLQGYVGSASTSSIQGAVTGTFLAFGLVVLFVL